MAHVTLQNVRMAFQSVVALKDISFEIKDGEFFVLLGPTGAGKTTTLRVISGLERRYSGSVLFCTTCPSPILQRLRYGR